MRNLVMAVLLASTAFAQLDSNALTVTATRQLQPTPDEVSVSITIGSGLRSTLDDVTASLRSTGVTTAQFTGVGTDYTTDGAERLSWSFSLTAPLADFRGAIDLLNAARRAMSHSGFTLTFRLQGAQASDKQRAALQCSQSNLIADARRRAQAAADAAGMVLGPILSIADATYAANVNQVPYAAIGYIFVPGFLTVPVTCSATVKFSLSRY